MVVDIAYREKTVGRDVYLEYYTKRVPGGRYAEGGFQIAHITPSGERQEVMSYEAAKKEAAQRSASYLNIPLYEITGYESVAPSGVIIGAGVQSLAEQKQAEDIVQAELQQKREARQAGFAGEFKTEYSQRMAAAPIGTPIPTQQEYMKIQALQTGKAVFGSEREFQGVTAPLAKYGAFAGATEFRGQIQPPPLQAFTPKTSYESPFGKGIIRPENFPGKLPEKRTIPEYESLKTYGIFQKGTQISTGLQAGLETTIGYGERAHPLIKAASGFGSVFTGLPAFGASALLGVEATAKYPKVLAGRLVPGAIKIGSELVEHVKTKPIETGGAVIGMALLGGGIKAPKIAGVKALLKEERAVSYAVFNKPPVMPGERLLKAAGEEIKPKMQYERMSEMFLPTKTATETKPFYTFRPGARTSVTQIAPKGTPTEAGLPLSPRQQMAAKKALQTNEPFLIAKIEPKTSRGFKELETKKAFRMAEYQKAEATGQMTKQGQIVLQVQKTRMAEPAVKLKTAAIEKTQFRAIALPQIRAQTLPMVRTAERTLTKVKPQTMTRTAIMVKPLSKTMPTIKTRTAVQAKPMVKTMPATMTRELTKTATQVRTKTALKTMTATQVGLRKPTKLKMKLKPSQFKLKSSFSKKGTRRFGEISRVASVSQILGGKKARRFRL